MRTGSIFKFYYHDSLDYEREIHLKFSEAEYVIAQEDE